MPSISTRTAEALWSATGTSMASFFMAPALKPYTGGRQAIRHVYTCRGCMKHNKRAAAAHGRALVYALIIWRV